MVSIFFCLKNYFLSFFISHQLAFLSPFLPSYFFLDTPHCMHSSLLPLSISPRFFATTFHTIFETGHHIPCSLANDLIFYFHAIFFILPNTASGKATTLSYLNPAVTSYISLQSLPILSPHLPWHQSNVSMAQNWSPILT